MSRDDHARPLRVGLFTYSTQARGGVVHTLELARALTHLGHAVTVTAPDESGRGFFRDGPYATRFVAAPPPTGDTLAFVRERIAVYVDALASTPDDYDVYHAHDGISANALATLVERGVIPRFVRTVHHLGGSPVPELAALEQRALRAAAATFVVSDLWRRRLAESDDIASVVVGNGVDAERFVPLDDTARLAVRSACGYDDEPVFLAVGGIEARKNTLGILDAFAIVRRTLPSARLVVVGGASVLDHRAYAARFAAAYDALDPAIRAAVDIRGVVTDDELVRHLQAADALVFPSVLEGFGLVILEALACGTPVVTSAIEPFTSILAPEDAFFATPDDPHAIARAMCDAAGPAVRARARTRGPALAERYSWARVACAHIATYHAAAETKAIAARA
jgi:glycosyltransferase-like protein